MIAKKFGWLIGFFLLVMRPNILLYAQDTTITDSRGRVVPEVLLNPISVDFRDIVISQALVEIEKKGNFHLNYREDIIPAGKKISVVFVDTPAALVLKKVLEGINIGFIVTHGDQIVLIKLNTLKAKEKVTISGYVTDSETGEALVGTNIYIGTSDIRFCLFFYLSYL